MSTAAVVTEEKLPNLQESIERAVADAPKVEEKKEEIKVEEKKEKVKVEEKKSELDLETQQALQLLKALQNPETAKDTLAFLNSQINKTTEKTGETKQAVAKDVITLLRENTSEQYHFLVDNLAKGIEAVINQKVQEGISPVKSAVDNATLAQSAKEVDAATTAFQKEHRIKDETDPIWVEIAKLSGELPWNGKGDIGTYLGRLHTIATKGQAETDKIVKTVKKIEENAGDLSLKSSEVTDARVTRGSKLPSLDEAVRSAFKGERI